MKRFKTKKKLKRTDIIIFIISVLSFLMLYIYNKTISYKVVDIIEAKMDEITTLIIKKDIAPLNKNLNDLIKINLNSSDEISYVDIDLDKSYKLTYEIVSKIQNNILLFEKGKIENDKFIKNKNDNMYLEVNLGLLANGALYNSFGPKLPVKIDFYEHVLGTVDVEVNEYGINNALLNVYLTVSLTHRLLLPYKKEEINKDYKMLIGTKVITGLVPSLYGTNITKSSSFEVEV